RTNAADLLTLIFALHHLPAPRRALAEFRRVLRPKGRLVVAAWGNEMSPLWRAFDQWYEAVGLGEARGVQQTEQPLNTIVTFREALHEAGFEQVAVIEERPPIRFTSLAGFWEWRVSFPAPNRVIRALAADERARLQAACLAALAPLVGDGEIDAD